MRVQGKTQINSMQLTAWLSAILLLCIFYEVSGGGLANIWGIGRELNGIPDLWYSNLVHS